MKCPTCGTELLNGQRFCEVCGTPQPQPTAPYAQSNQYNTSVPFTPVNQESHSFDTQYGTPVQPINNYPQTQETAVNGYTQPTNQPAGNTVAYPVSQNVAPSIDMQYDMDIPQQTQRPTQQNQFSAKFNTQRQNPPQNYQQPQYAYTAASSSEPQNSVVPSQTTPQPVYNQASNQGYVVQEPQMQPVYSQAAPQESISSQTYSYAEQQPSQYQHQVDTPQMPEMHPQNNEPQPYSAQQPYAQYGAYNYQPTADKTPMQPVSTAYPQSQYVAQPPQDMPNAYAPNNQYAPPAQYNVPQQPAQPAGTQSNGNQSASQNKSPWMIALSYCPGVFWLGLADGSPRGRKASTQGLLIGALSLAGYIVLGILWAIFALIRIGWLGATLYTLFSLGIIALIVFAVIKGFKGEDFELPVIGKFKIFDR